MLEAHSRSPRSLAEVDAPKVREIRANVAEKRIELELEQLNAPPTTRPVSAMAKAGVPAADDRATSALQPVRHDQITMTCSASSCAGARLHEKQIAAITRRCSTQARRAQAVGGGGGGVDKEAQVQRTIAGLKTRSFELDTKLTPSAKPRSDKLQHRAASASSKQSTQGC